MELTRAYKFRIYPDATRQGEIDERLILAQQFYNKILEKSIESYKNEKTKVSMAQFHYMSFCFAIIYTYLHHTSYHSGSFSSHP